MSISSSKKEESEKNSYQSLSTSIKAELNKLDQSSQFSKRCCIYRVPKLLRKLNEEAYTPVLVSIGPFHYKNERLLPMDTHKLKYLKSFIEHSKTKRDLNFYVEIIKDKESQIRECYAEPIHMSSDEFVRMVLIDSIFIIEIFRSYMFMMPFTIGEVTHDLTLVENQMPFFILKDLHSSAFKSDDHMNSSTTSFTNLVCKRLKVDKSRVEVDPITNEASACCHLLDLQRSHYLPSQQKTDTIEMHQHVDIDDRSIFCPTATSLHEAGVKFRVSNKPCSLPDIHFDKEKGILTIPKLLVVDQTEYLFRNMIAFEQCHYNHHEYIANYQVFMDCLIDTREDVRFLAKAGIIDNCLGSEKEVATLMNSLSKNLFIYFRHYNYASITEQLNKHRNKRWNRYRATLKHTYFKHPWAVLSVIYAVILLLITFAQLLTGILAVPGVKK